MNATDAPIDGWKYDNRIIVPAKLQYDITVYSEKLRLSCSKFQIREIPLSLTVRRKRPLKILSSDIYHTIHTNHASSDSGKGCKDEIWTSPS